VRKEEKRRRRERETKRGGVASGLVVRFSG
jgi:hypothetical protein